jgi:hypothetical protein
MASRVEKVGGDGSEVGRVSIEWVILLLLFLL